MKAATALVVSFLGLASVIGVVALPQQSSARPDCTKLGTPHDDILSGSRHRDVICALAGDDYVHGSGGRDVLRGGSGNDVLVGGAARDIARGRSGDDRLFLVDGNPGEVAGGGRGRDQCFVDRGDRAIHCESVFRGASIRVARALSQSFYQAMVLSEELIEPSPGPAAVTVTVTTTAPTVTVTVPFPPCASPPPSPPTPC